MSGVLKKVANLIPPRLIRLRDAPFYLGMDRNRFSSEVRPYLTELPIGKQGIAFDRLDLDAWVEDYKSCNGRPSLITGDKTWDNKKYPASKKEAKPGISTRLSVEKEYAKLLRLDQEKRPRSTSHNLKQKPGDAPS